MIWKQKSAFGKALPEKSVFLRVCLSKLLRRPIEKSVLQWLCKHSGDVSADLYALAAVFCTAQRTGIIRDIDGSFFYDVFDFEGCSLNRLRFAAPCFCPVFHRISHPKKAEPQVDFAGVQTVWNIKNHGIERMVLWKKRWKNKSLTFPA